MSATERAGKRLFLIFSTVIVLGNLGVAWQGLFSYGAGPWWIISLGLALAVPYLWNGYPVPRYLVVGALFLSGGLALFEFARNLSDFDVGGWSLEPTGGILGLAELLGGLAFLYWPSLQAFFRYQRERALTDSTAEGRPLLASSNRRPLRGALKTGLKTSGVCLLALVVLSATWGGVFGFHPSATIFGQADPGWQGALSMLSISVVFASLPVAGAGFVLGFLVSLFVRES